MKAVNKSISKGCQSYDLTPRNKKYLANLISVVTRKKYEEIYNYFQEFENDDFLHNHFDNMIKMKPFYNSIYGTHIYVGKRIG
jgi:hypothetical protein